MGACLIRFVWRLAADVFSQELPTLMTTDDTDDNYGL